jgi:uncharacterized membrane protein
MSSRGQSPRSLARRFDRVDSADGRLRGGADRTQIGRVATIRGRALSFVKTTLIGGVVFLVPLVVLLVLVTKTAGYVHRLAAPLVRLLPVETIAGTLVADVLAVLGVVLACFLAGLLAHFSMAHRFVAKAEANVLWRIPGYGIIKGLTDSLDPRAPPSLRPVLVHFDDYAQIAFEVDRAADGRCIIYLPSAPEPRTGSVIVMEPEQVEPLEMGFVATAAAIRSLGHGLGPSLRSRAETTH